MTEIVTCPRCQRKLQVPEEYIGRQVQCPECQTAFVASTMAVTAQPSSKAPAPLPASDDRRRRGDRYDHDYDDDFDEDAADVRRHRIHRDDFAPHRGTLILVLGLLGLVGGLSCLVPFVLGPVAWGLAHHDLKEIHAGRMDPSGKSMTRTGQVFGIISTVCLLIMVAVFACLALTGA